MSPMCSDIWCIVLAHAMVSALLVHVHVFQHFCIVTSDAVGLKFDKRLVNKHKQVDTSSVHGSGAIGLRVDFRLLRVSYGICGSR